MKSGKWFLWCSGLALVGALLLQSEAGVSAQGADKGEKLFADKGCKACHSIGGGKLVGPDLKGSLERWGGDRAALKAFIKDPKSANSDYATKLRKEFNDMMTPQALGDADLEAIIDFIAGGKGTGAPVNITHDETNRKLGSDLFMGIQPFANGAPPCVSCHALADVGGFGGGSLASRVGTGQASLDKAHSRNGGDAGLHAALSSPQFPVMKKVFADAPLTEPEVNALVAYLAEQDKSNATASSWGAVGFVLLALAGAGVMIVGFDLIWKKRFRNVRKTLVGEAV
ncbi:MAG: cytochrome c, partial [Planctomycetes bacterium]|nr:cytochrome c [Planctomycetota bacterium]